MSLETFTLICDMNFRVFNEEIFPYLLPLTGILSNLVDGCDISSLSVADKLSLYQKLSYFLSLADNAIYFMIINLDVIQDTFNNFLGLIPDNYITEFAHIDLKAKEFIVLFENLVTIFRDLENGLCMHNLISDLRSDFLNEPL